MLDLFAAPDWLPQGALRQADGGVEWRIWAPRRPDLRLVAWPGGQPAEFQVNDEGHGYLSCRMEQVEDGLRYAWRLADGRDLPDPASRWQPDGVHAPSAVFTPESFAWTDADWPGLTMDDLVLYELHVGAFTPDGTLDAVIGRLPELKSLGVTAIELMPLAQFPGGRNWGYDGVHPYAVQNTYGGPRALQRLVDAAHAAGLGVILDVVYNHLGPEGNYLQEFGPYFTDRYRTPWGQALNFDDRDCGPVRRFVINNACMWIRDFHVDGLRLDAVHAIFDLGTRHLLADLHEAVEQSAPAGRLPALVIAESDQNDARLLLPREQWGCGLDGVWSDDFHHAVHALLTGERDGYYCDFGTPLHLAKAFNQAFVYDGCYSAFRRRRHGGPIGDLARERFVICTQNHDQVGNRALGERLSALLSPPALRLAAALLLLSPDTPLLFMGQEYGETRPFPFFCSFGDPGLIEAITNGRQREFADLAFEWHDRMPDPHAEETFAAARLSWNWRDDPLRSGLRRLYGDLLAMRRQWPALRDRGNAQAEVVDVGDEPVAAPGLLMLRRGARMTALANLGSRPQPVPAGQFAEDWLPRLSTEDARYGGGWSRADDPREPLSPYELRVFAAQEQP
jgi:maltooligosyltrehalose trehalohydrolase